MIPRPLTPEINYHNPNAVQSVIKHHREKKNFHGAKQGVFIDRHHMIVGLGPQHDECRIQDMDE